MAAEVDGKIIGILIGCFQPDLDWKGKTGKIDAIIVDKKQRRMGVGKWLA